jgi:SAM-dependent methyltransferase
MTDVTSVNTSTTASATAQPGDLQAQITEFWNWRSATKDSGALAIRSEQELQIWADVMRGLLPPAPADVVDLGTGQGFLALVCAALGHRVRGFDISEVQVGHAREFAARAPNPPVFEVGDANSPDLPPASLDVVTNRNILWTLIDAPGAFRNWFNILRPGGRLVTFHGISPDGESEDQKEKRFTHYTDAVKERLLPIHRVPTFDPVIPLVRDAGFVDLQVTRFESIERFDLEFANQDKIWQVLTAVRPSDSRT